MATHLALHFQKAGHRVTCIYSRSGIPAQQLAERVGAKGTRSPASVPRESDFYFLCVPDAVVPEVSRQFTGYHGIWLHCAGALPMDVLAAHPRYGVFYPLQTFSRELPLSPDTIPVLVEGSSGEVTGEIKKLAGSVSGTVRLMETPDRLALHLAAVFANNFTNHMVHIAQQILRKNGVDQQLIFPLLEETVHKLSTMEAADAQTGPALRGDRETMQRHLELLKAYPEWENLYTFISRNIRDSHRGSR